MRRYRDTEWVLVGAEVGALHGVSRLASSLRRPPRRAGRVLWRSTDLSVEWPSNVGVGNEAGSGTQRSVQLVEPGNPTKAEHPNQGEAFGYLGRELNFIGAHVERLAF